jgi:hypothetical protein
MDAGPRAAGLWEILLHCSKSIDSERAFSAQCPPTWSWSMPRTRLSALPSILMPCACGGRMQTASARPLVHADGTEDISYRCSICRTELIATRMSRAPGYLGRSRLPGRQS